MLRACVSYAGVMMCRGEACAGSFGVCMCFMSLCSSERVYAVYESIVPASSTVLVGMSVLRTRFDIHTLQEPMARAWLAQGRNPYQPPER